MNKFTLFGVEYTKESFLKLSDICPCEKEYNRFMTAETEEEILKVIFYNFKWVNVHILHLYDNAYSFSEGLALVKKAIKWGYVDKNGKEVIPFSYDDAYSFSEGLALVKKAIKWGYVDKNGKEVIPFSYDDACSFSEGLARVYKDGKWGFIYKN